MQFPLGRTRIAARYTLRGIGYIAAYLTLGTFTSVVATIFGIIFIFTVGMAWAGPVAVVANPLILIIGLPIGFLLSMPVTFVVCPLLTVLLKKYPATNLFALAVSGAITGGLMTWWWIGLSKTFSKVAPEFILGGTAAGLVAGMTYAAMVRNARGTQAKKMVGPKGGSR